MALLTSKIFRTYRQTDEPLLNPDFKFGQNKFENKIVFLTFWFGKSIYFHQSFFKSFYRLTTLTFSSVPLPRLEFAEESLDLLSLVSLLNRYAIISAIS